MSEDEEYPIEEKPACSAILNRDDFTCQLCGHEPDPEEPMESVFMGGDEGQEDPEYDVTNYATCCQDCARNHRAGLTRVARQQQKQINTRQYSRGEKTEGQLRALPALFFAMATFVWPFAIHHELAEHSVGPGVALQGLTIDIIPLLITGFLWPIATWFCLMVGSWIEPHEGIMTKIRIWVGGFIYYDIYRRLVRYAISRLY